MAPSGAKRRPEGAISAISAESGRAARARTPEGACAPRAPRWRSHPPRRPRCAQAVIHSRDADPGPETSLVAPSPPKRPPERAISANSAEEESPRGHGRPRAHARRGRPAGGATLRATRAALRRLSTAETRTPVLRRHSWPPHRRNGTLRRPLVPTQARRRRRGRPAGAATIRAGLAALRRLSTAETRTPVLRRHSWPPHRRNGPLKGPLVPTQRRREGGEGRAGKGGGSPHHSRLVENAASKAAAGGVIAFSFRTNAIASGAPSRRSMPASSHSTLVGPS